MRLGYLALKSTDVKHKTEPLTLAYIFIPYLHPRLIMPNLTIGLCWQKLRYSLCDSLF